MSCVASRRVKEASQLTELLRATQLFGGWAPEAADGVARVAEHWSSLKPR